ncbi:MAG: translation initiation factor IF-2, partial [Balneolaceae bacterium]
MTDQKPKKLFKVASEFNVATQSIVDTLSENGFDVANRPNSKITYEMYVVLIGVYGDDKEKSLEHEKAREEYESRRNQIMSNRNEKVTIDNFLEPIDDLPLEPEEEKEEPEAKKEEETAKEKEGKAAVENTPEPTLEPQEEEEKKPEAKEK